MVYTDISNGGPAVSVRRTGTTVCFLFGFGLLAVVMAGNASADDQRPGDEPVSVGTAESVTGLLSPVTGTIEPVSSVVLGGSAVLEFVLAPVVEVVEPVATAVVSSVISTVTPIVDPVLGPLTDSQLDPVPTAPSPTSPPPAVPDTPEAAVPQQESGSMPSQGPAPSWIATGSPVAVQGLDRSYRDGSHASAALAGPARFAGSGDTDGTPVIRIGPFSTVLGGGSASGPGGSSGADLAVSTPGHSSGLDNGSGRDPPGSVAGHMWFGYDDRDHPS